MSLLWGCLHLSWAHFGAAHHVAHSQGGLPVVAFLTQVVNHSLINVGLPLIVSFFFWGVFGLSRFCVIVFFEGHGLRAQALCWQGRGAGQLSWAVGGLGSLSGTLWKRITFAVLLSSHLAAFSFVLLVSEMKVKNREKKTICQRT